MIVLHPDAGARLLARRRGPLGPGLLGYVTTGGTYLVADATSGERRDLAAVCGHDIVAVRPTTNPDLLAALADAIRDALSHPTRTTSKTAMAKVRRARDRAAGADAQLRAAVRAACDAGTPVAKMAAEFGVARTTVYRWLKSDD